MIKGLILKMMSLIAGISYALPYSPLRGIVVRFIRAPFRSVLDIGCGQGKMMQSIRVRHKQHFFAVGVDIHLPSLIKAKSKKLYNDLVLADVRNLPFRDKSFEIVISVEVIEHLAKEEGLQLMHRMEEIATQQSLISTPNGYMTQNATHDNVYWSHKSGWEVKDFKRLGYDVKGQCGPRIGENMRGFMYYLSFFLPFGLLFVGRPENSYWILALKNVNNFVN